MCGCRVFFSLQLTVKVFNHSSNTENKGNFTVLIIE
jgi:hypothetical protein